MSRYKSSLLVSPLRIDWQLEGGVGIQILALFLWAFFGTLYLHVYFWWQKRLNTSDVNFCQTFLEEKEEDEGVSAERNK